MAEGLRERKKRQTRQHISDTATGLFLERGFDAVTIAEIAEAADVSVNTVYNYFATKEDLFLDRSEEVTTRLARWVRGRPAGESAAAAVLRELRAEVEAISPKVGLVPGWERFLLVIHAAPTLRSSLWGMQQEVQENLEAELRAELATGPADPLPGLIAGQITWAHEATMSFIGREMMAGRAPEEVSREALAVLDEIEDLLGAKVRDYAVRTAR